jgi:hypothetical protein
MATVISIVIIALIAWGLYGGLLSRKYPRNKDQR